MRYAGADVAKALSPQLCDSLFALRSKARELEEKHQVSAKVGAALGRGLDRLSAMLGALVAMRVIRRNCPV
jgi:hypothetical protein